MRQQSTKWRKVPTAAEKRALLVRSLYERMPHMLERLQPDALAAQYGVDTKIAEFELVMARQNRAKEL